MARQHSQSQPTVVSSIKDPAVLLPRQRLGQAGGQPPVSYLVEGRKRVRQALDAPSPVEAVFLRAPASDDECRDLQRCAAERGVACHVVSRGAFVRIHDLGYETSVDALACVARRPLAELPLPAEGDYCLLIGERTQDPKNVGSLIRTADAWAVTAAAFTADSADPYARGSVRASTGSILRVPVGKIAHLDASIARLKAASVRVIGTSAHASTRCWEADLTGPCAIVLGNESVGLSDGAAALCDERVAIPMPGGAHSFNIAVAAGIVLYERMRQTHATRQ